MLQLNWTPSSSLIMWFDQQRWDKHGPPHQFHFVEAVVDEQRWIVHIG